MHIFIILFVYFMLGALAGTLSGLLGIGGGLVVVPALSFIFGHEHISEQYIMHLAVGTSLAIMIMTTSRTLIAHLAHTDQPEGFWRIAKNLLPGVFVGVIMGGVLAKFIHSNILHMVFGVLVLLVAMRLLFFTQNKECKRTLPGANVLRIAGGVMGMLSGMLGIGGGATVIPYMVFYQIGMRTALKLAVGVGLLAACVGTVTYIVAGLGDAELPANTIGYIYWPAWVGASIGSVLFAPLGTRLSYYLPADLLRRIFAVLMVVVGIHMIFK